MSGHRYLLDTNIVSDLVRNPDGRVRGHIRTVGYQTICTSVIAACELRFGIVKSGSKRLGENLLAIMESITVLPFGDGVDRHYGRIRAELEAAGRPIGANDLFVAAHALSLDLTLVTHNVREFGCVAGLRVEDWLA